MTMPNMPMPAAPTSNHGFNLFGRHSLALCHIPMFMPPHQAQVFLEVTLAGPAGTDPLKVYLEDQAASKSTDYVLLSDPIQLPTLAPNATPGIQSFTGKLYRGWPFDTPNTAPVIVPQLTVHITRKIYWHSILNEPMLKTLTYLGFHTAETGYLVHQLVQPPNLNNLPNPPDFYQVLSAKFSEAGPTSVPRIEFPGVTNQAANKLAANQSVKGILAGSQQVLEARTVSELIYDPNHLMPG